MSNFNRRLARGIGIAALLGLIPAGGQASEPTSKTYQQGVADWSAHRYPAAYKEFYATQSEASGKDWLPVYYLLTSACRSENPQAAVWGKRLLGEYAADVPGSEWAALLTSEQKKCGAHGTPASPPMMRTSQGALLPFDLPQPGITAYYKSISGDPLKDSMPATGSYPVDIGGESLPPSLLNLPRTASKDGVRHATNIPLNDSKYYVGRYHILIESGLRSGFFLSDVAQATDGFVDQLISEYGMVPPRTYMMVVAYPSLEEIDPKLPDFPGAYGRMLGVSDTRTNTSYVRADGKMHGTIFHEITHLLVASTIGATAPEWLNEGLASSFEQTDLVEGRYVGAANWRAIWLSGNPKAIPSVRAIIGGTPYMNGSLLEDRDVIQVRRDAAIMNAAQRYLLLFLQEKKLAAQTVRFYAGLRLGPDQTWSLATPEGRVAVFEAATGQKIDLTQARFSAWLKEALKRKFQMPQFINWRALSVKKD